MIWFVIGMTLVIATPLITGGYGKFWHKHDWYVIYEHRLPSMYSDSKEDRYTVYRCHNCSAFVVDTDTVKLAPISA